MPELTSKAIVLYFTVWAGPDGLNPMIKATLITWRLLLYVSCLGTRNPIKQFPPGLALYKFNLKYILSYFPRGDKSVTSHCFIRK